MERELWLRLYTLVKELDTSWTNVVYRASDIVAVYLWSVIHDRPMSWACERCNWDGVNRVWLPSQSTMSRRLRTRYVQELLDRVEARLGGDLSTSWVRRIDGKPLPVGHCTKDPDAKLGRAGDCFARGYKLHAVWEDSPIPSVWMVQPMNVGEAKVAQKLVRRLSGEGYILGDSQYDSNPLHDVAMRRGQQVVAPPKRSGKGLGHRRHSPARLRSLELLKTQFGQSLYQFRSQIERDFGRLTSHAVGLGPLPSWVRRIHRVRLWVQAKLLIHAVRVAYVDTPL